MRRLLLLVLLLASGVAAPVRAQVAERLGDLRRTAAVRAALALDAQTRAYDVGVTAERGVVTLAGVVGTRGARERAEALARRVPGVADVRNALRLEGQPDAPVAEPAPREAAAVEEDVPGEDEAVPEIVEPEPAETEAPRTAYHTVGRGDTLYSIARRYGTTVAALQRLNDLRSADAIRVGQRLRVR